MSVNTSEYILDISKEPIKIQERILKVVKQSNNKAYRLDKRIELTKSTQQERWCEDKYDAECKKRNI